MNTFIMNTGFVTPYDVMHFSNGYAQVAHNAA
jgi:hypothetical protein